MHSKKENPEALESTCSSAASAVPSFVMLVSQLPPCPDVFSMDLPGFSHVAVCSHVSRSGAKPLFCRDESCSWDGDGTGNAELTDAESVVVFHCCLDV